MDGVYSPEHQTNGLPRHKGHFRSSSLENNVFYQSKQIPNTNFTGTLKSKREQKRIAEILIKQKNNGNEPQQSNKRKSQFESIRNIFEKNTQNYNNGPNYNNLKNEANYIMETEEKPPKIQPCSGVLEQGKQVIRPIAFKPIPFKPDYTQNYGVRFNEMGERYGSTPSLGPYLGTHPKFGSTSDLRYHPNRKVPFKTYDSLESVRKTPDSVASTTSTIKSLGIYSQDLIDMTPSPSDSGISELEAALRDRDSELAYLRQTMEHNEHVIFKVHQDKEKIWEQEIKRMRAIHDSRLRASAQKIQKYEQLLMMQTYQLKQDKKRLVEDSQRLTGDMTEIKDQNEHFRNELCHLKIIEKDLKEQNSDLLEEVQVLRRVVGELKGRLEESEWNLCQKSGELALVKSQLKEAQNELTTKDQEIIHLKAEIRNQNSEERNTKKSEVQRDVDVDMEISQLNRIIILKDQVIIAMTNELQKLRKELSDIAILKCYEGIPAGRHFRYKKKFPPKDEQQIKNDENSEECDINLLLENIEKLKINNRCDIVDKKDDLIPIKIDPPAQKLNSMEIEKKIFLNSQICNYTEQDDKNNFTSLTNTTNLPDITLNLNCNLDLNSSESSSIDYNVFMSSPNDFSEDMIEYHVEEDPVIEKYKQKKVDLLCNGHNFPDNSEIIIASLENVNETETDRLRGELKQNKIHFEQERIKWADEKEKVLIYQRQLQFNYVQMFKKSQVLENKLKEISSKVGI